MSRQLFAKLGVFGLIVLNLGAYYVFWPDNGSHGNGVDKTDNSGKPMPMASNASAAQPGDPWKPSPPDPALPAPKATSPQPKSPAVTAPTADPTLPNPDPLAGSAPSGAVNIPSIPEPVGLAGQPAPIPEDTQTKPVDPTKVQLKRLMDTFKKEESTPAAPPTPPPTPPADPLAGGVLPQGQPPHPVISATNVSTKPIQTENSPWSLQWEFSEGRTALTARLNKRLEFRIVGDRVKMETPDGAVVASGKVKFIGPGLKGSCERLSIGLTGETLVLEGKAELQVQQGNLSDLAIPTVDLKGEQFSVRLQQLTSGVTPVQGVTNPTGGSGIIPATVSPATPSPFTSPRDLLIPNKK
jgi:hypothetical protein